MKFLVLALSFGLCSVSYSQDEKVETLESIEVSGNKEGRTYQETPESVTILPPARINRGDQNSNLEVLNGQANVQVAKNAEVFSIRGISNTGATGFQKDNLASIFVDGVFQTDIALRAGSFETWDLEALEVYRGPQSTSQGVNSLAGAIILNHTAPEKETAALLKGGYGSFNRRELGAVANKAFLDKKLAVRLSFNKDDNDGFIENKTTGNKKWGRQNRGHAVADFKYFFDDKSTLRFNTKFMRTDNGGNYTIGGNPFDYTVYEDQDYRAINNNQQNSFQYVKPWSSQVTTTSTLAFSKSLQHSKSDADGTRNPTAGRRDEFATDQFASFENVIKYNSDKVKNALGFHTHQFRGFNNYDFSILLSGTPIHFIQDLDKKRETYAVFDSLLYKLDSNLSLNLGARYEFVKNDYGTFVNPLTVTGNAGTDAYLNKVRGAYDGQESNQVFLPKVGLIYDISATNSLGLTYSQGYRIGGLDINRSKAKTVEYGPEFTDNYEGSWKFTNDRFQTQMNIFYTKWREQQVEVRFSNTDTYDSQVENASSSELYGGEFEGLYSFETGDTLRFGVGHVHTRFLDFNNNGTSYTGNEFPDAANWTAQTAWGHLFTETISSNLTLRHVSRSFTNAENTRSAPEQLYLDLNLQYAGESYVWELNGKNLLGEQYVLNSTAIYNENYKRTNRPREVNTRVTWFW